MRESDLPVPGALRPWVERISVAAFAAGDGRPLIHVPDPATVLVWRTRADGDGAALVVGPRTHASYHHGKDIPLCVRIRIRPGSAQALLGVPAADLVDRVVPLEELWGGLDLAGLGPGRVAARLEAAVLRRIARLGPDERERAALVRAAAAELPAAPVTEVARRVGLSERQLRTVFTAAVGVPPKRFSRLARVRTLLRGAGSRPWARLAGEAGYYDQSHMTAEFRAVMKVTPKTYVAGRLPTVPC